MGMAASQARYLALVARKANCEYEGQQINQSRLNLANQTATLFTQMMGLEVPIPPSIQDYTKLQYSFSNGTTDFAITDWKQLSAEDSDGYNYLVTYYYEINEPKGSQKLRSNPQVQFRGSGPSSTTDYNTQIATIEAALKTVAQAQKDYDDSVSNYKSLVEKSKSLSYYADNTTFTNIKQKEVFNDPDTNESGYRITRQDITSDGYQIYTYTYTPEGGTEPVTENRYLKNNKYYKYDATTEQYIEVTNEDTTQYQEKLESRNYISYNTLASDEDKTAVATAIDTLKSAGAISEDFKYEDAYYDKVNKALVFYSDIKDVPGTTRILPLYYPGNPPAGKTGIAETQQEITSAETQMELCKSALEVAEATLNALDLPTYVGNSELTPLYELDDNQAADILQIIKDMRENNIDNNIIRCFDTMSGTYSKDTYTGGIYSFVSNGTTYYTTYYDLANSYISGGANHIDGQDKLPTYTSGYVKTRKDSVERALLDTNTEGRFTTIRLENDSIVYPLQSESVKDDVGYEDAMNQYTYNKALYDKKVADLNAQTSLIQREDQDLELRLKQLDTEQNALNTEIDAVSKVVKDNIEKSFKTFSG